MDYLVEAKKFVQLLTRLLIQRLSSSTSKWLSGASLKRLRRETARPVKSLAIRTEAQPEVV
jgi:hypothetical protein